jgi:hypothetical protein
MKQCKRGASRKREWDFNFSSEKLAKGREKK